MNAYHHGLKSDHRLQAAMRTAHKVGDAFEVTGSSRLAWDRITVTAVLVFFWFAAAFVVSRLAGCA